MPDLVACWDFTVELHCAANWLPLLMLHGTLLPLLRREMAYC